MATLERFPRIARLTVGFVSERLGPLERWLLISTITSLTASLAIGLFYVLLRVVIAASAYIHGLPNPSSFLGVSDYSIVALESGNRIAIVVTLLGFTALASIIVYRFAPEAEGGGTDAVVEAYHHGAGRIRARVALVKAVASAFILGGGGSAGPEGPAVQIGGAAGSFSARLLGLSVEERKIALISGVAAALSFIFQSPVGSALFAVEILYMYDIEATALVPSLMASVIAYSLSIHILGPGYKLPSIPLHDVLTLYSFDALASYIMLGIYVAVFAHLYILLFRSAKDTFSRLVEEKKINIYMKPVIGAAVTSVIGILLPEILGTGEEYLSEQLHVFQHIGTASTLFIIYLILLAVAKLAATSLVVGSGGSGGLLAPGLYAGAMAGMAFGLLVHSYTGVPAALYAYLGMAALFGAASNIPLGMSFLVAEIGGSPVLIVPALVSSFSAYMLVRGVSIVESQLPHRIPPQIFTAEMLLGLVRERGLCIKASEIASKNVTVARWDEPLAEVARRMLSSRQRIAVVVDSDGRVVGVFDPAYAGIDLRYALKSSEQVSEVAIATAPTVPGSVCVSRVLEQMILYGTDYVVVVSQGRRFEGIIFLNDVVNVLVPQILSGSKT